MVSRRKYKELVEQYNSLQAQIKELEKQVRNTDSKAERTGIESKYQNKFNRAELELKINNLDNKLELCTQNVNTLFTPESLNEVRQKILEGVQDVAKNYVEELTNETIKTNVIQFLTDKVKELVVENAEGKIDGNALSLFADQVVQAILPQILVSPEEVKRENEPIANREPADLKGELLHKQFTKLLETVSTDLAPMLVGPAGTGKSTAVEQVARVLGLPFYMANRVGQAYELTGYTDAQGRYVETPFYQAYKNGGVFFFDEIDGSDPEALVTINTAIAQGYNVFCGEKVNKHPNFRLVAAGNTYGTGADAEYCGRNQLDSATLDRFVVIPWGYDKNLEQQLVGDQELLDFAWALRQVVQKNHLKIIVSTRGILATHKLMQSSSFTLAENLESNLLEGVDVDTLQTIKSGLSQVGYDVHASKYAEAINDVIVNQKNGGQTKC